MVALMLMEKQIKRFAGWTNSKPAQAQNHHLVGFGWKDTTELSAMTWYG